MVEFTGKVIIMSLLKDERERSGFIVEAVLAAPLINS
jgi:hypothetical protein